MKIKPPIICNGCHPKPCGGCRWENERCKHRPFAKGDHLCRYKQECATMTSPQPQRDLIIALFRRIGQQLELKEEWDKLPNAERNAMAGAFYNIIKEHSSAGEAEKALEVLGHIEDAHEILFNSMIGVDEVDVGKLRRVSDLLLAAKLKLRQQGERAKVCDECGNSYTGTGYIKGDKTVCSGCNYRFRQQGGERR